MRTKYPEILVTLCLAPYMTVSADIKIPQFFTDNMLVQRNSVLTIPGTAEAGAKITVLGSWNNREVASVADKNGNFRLKLSTPEAGGPYTIVIRDNRDSEPVVLQNVLAGDLWLCSGQSNMEFPVRGWSQVMDADRVVATSNHPDIRMLQIHKNTALTPRQDAEVNMGGWVEASPAAMDFSAIAYLFALQLQQEIGIPIGVIDSSWGGTPVQSWTSLKGVESNPWFGDEVSMLRNPRAGGNNITEEYSRLYDAWLDRLMAADRMDDKSRFHSEWAEMPVPGLWEDSVLPGFDGIVWMQKEIEVPREAAGHPLTLTLGSIDNMDDTYFNGVRVGGMDDYAATRCYKVAADLVKAGKNVISVRVIDFDGGGGIYGNPENIKAEVAGNTIRLNGNWKYLSVADRKDFPDKPASPESSWFPTALYNAMIAPIGVMPVKGVLWYQGCANVDHADRYAAQFKNMIADWRRLYGNDSLPFYFVQLAGFLKPQLVQPDSQWALLRDAQARALDLPATGMATAIDLGHPDDIHPVNKQEVARRLALLALNNDYGRKDLVCVAPTYKDIKTGNGKVTITFDAPVSSASGALSGFIIGDEAGKFVSADARRINDTTIELSSPVMKKPVKVRYNWADYPGGSLRGDSGLPVTPFATDIRY